MDYEERFNKRLKDEKLDSQYEIVKKNFPLLIIKHKICENSFTIRGESEFFVKNHRCFFCEIKEKTNNKFEVLEYKQAHNSQIYLIKCKTCGEVFQTNRNKFENVGIICRNCNKSKIKYNDNSFKNKLTQIYNGEYELIGHYNSKRISLLYKPTGEIYNNIIPQHFLEGRNIKDNRNLTTEEYKKEIQYYYGNSIKVLSEYKNCKSKILFYHKNCKGNGYFKRGAKDMLDSARLGHSENGCPYCKEISYGESLLRKIFEKQFINFAEQYKFSNCIYKKQLPFDFAIFENNKLSYLIEFQGSQHYNFEGHETFYSNIQDYKDRVIKDNIKQDYCSNNNIKLLKIPYTKISILEKILKNQINLKFNDYPKVVNILQQEQGQVVGENPLNRNIIIHLK